MRQAAMAVMLALATALTSTARAAAQQEPSSELINIFFDCQAPGCRDDDFFRRQIPFVNWVRDRQVADVHVLIRSEQTGGGGQQYRLAFIGLEALEGTDYEAVLSTSGDATSDEERSAIAERVKLALVPYVQNTPAADRLRIVFEEADDELSGAGGPTGLVSASDDPWDFWVFRINANGFLNGQASASSSNMFGNASAQRTTDRWKLNVGGEYSRNVPRFQISDGSTVRETRQDWGTNGLAVRSIGNRWAVGARADIGSSTFLNQDLRWTVKPGIEFNFFPYEQSSRRSLTLQYLIGPSSFDYSEETIYQKMEETLAQQSLTASLSLVQP